MNINKIIARHDQELSKYIEDVSSKMPEYFREHAGPYEQLFQIVHTYFLFMNYVRDNMDQELIPNQPMILYFQIASSLSGLECCLRNGQLHPAYVVLRNLFETELTLALLTEADMEDRCKLYSDYEMVGRWLNLKAHEKLIVKSVISQDEFENLFTEEEIKSIEEDYDSIKAFYHPDRPHHWAWSLFATGNRSNNPTIQNIAERLDRLEDYSRLYSALSVIAHASPRSCRAITASDGMITPGPLFNRWTSTAIGLALGYCHQGLLHIKTYLDQGMRDELEIYSTELFSRAMTAIPSPTNGAA